MSVVLILRLAEDERLVGVAEGLSYHCHYHGNLAGRAVYAELRVGIGTFIYIGEEDFVSRLVQYSGNAEHQYGPAVREHSAHKGAVEHVFEARKLLHQEEHQRAGAEQVDVESVAYAHLRRVNLAYKAIAARAFVPRREGKEEHKVERD